MSAETKKTFRVIDRAALKAKLDKKEKFHLWNVVTKEYFKPDVNIPGSRWIPVDTLAETLKKEKIGKNDEIVAYCASTQCPASKKAAEQLVALGYTRVSAYEGGLKDWHEGGLPLTTI